jgi:hypothetical protein
MMEKKKVNEHVMDPRIVDLKDLALIADRKKAIEQTKVCLQEFAAK